MNQKLKKNFIEKNTFIDLMDLNIYLHPGSKKTNCREL